MSGEVALVISGGSGMVLAQRCAIQALQSEIVTTLHVVLSEPARLVLGHELGAEWATPDGFQKCLHVSEELRSRIRMWSDDDLMAPISSGSHRLRGTIVLPCSAGTAGAVAQGISRGLGQRVADVALKQKWPLIIGIRETPMSAILLANLARLAAAGAVIMPPVPAFYVAPGSAGPEDIFIDHYCMRVLDFLNITSKEQGLRWRE